MNPDGTWSTKDLRRKCPEVSRFLAQFRRTDSRSGGYPRKQGDGARRLQEEIMTSPKAETEASERSTAELDRCYGQIGISAVRAALPYKGEEKNTAYAPRATQPQTA
jgi:hypothetical protein